MRIVILDFESMYTDEKDARGRPYTLSHLTTEEYVRHELFEAHGAAIKWSPNHDAKWYPEKELRHVLKEEDWSDTWLFAWHMQFDGLILTHHYGVKPKMWGCPMSMARMLIGNHISVSLDSVRKHFNLPPKTTPYNLFKGKHWREMTPDTQRLVAEGCEDEVESVWKIFQRLAPSFPPEEYEVIDMTMRMFVEPQLRADTQLLAKVWTDEATRKAERLAALNIAESELQSADKFTALLEAEGVEIEMKKGKNGDIPAFAKTDEFMKGLLDDENDRVRGLAEARLGVKSTLMQTRAESLGWMASRGPMPVYLRYCGAGTLRFSGGDSANWQNFKRNSDLRRAILAPEGYLLAPLDASQIECRVLNYLAGQHDMIEKFRSGEDPYVGIASEFYNEKIYKPEKGDPRKAEMEMKRGAGKQAELMCLGPNTRVLTKRGVISITSVLANDWLWDGEEWVTHQGLKFQGIKQTILVANDVQMTCEHLVLCGNTWLPAQQVKGKFLSRALASGMANLPSQATKLDATEGLSPWWSSARAEHRNTPLTLTICMQAAQRAVTLALRRWPGFGLKNITAMLMCAPMSHTGAGCWAGLEQFTQDANQKTLILISTMADEEFRFASNGKTTVENFWNIWSHFRDGMIRLWRLIESTIKKATSPETFVLPHDAQIHKTDDVSAISNKRLPTYDIACSGPRNRFTIVSSAGPLIVHNCGYGAAAKKYRSTAKAGQYGPPIDISIEEAQRHVSIYRDTHPAICLKGTGYWAQANRMLARLAGGEPVQWGPLLVKDHRIYLPNGACMIYDTLEYHHPSDSEEVKEFERDGYWRMQTRQGWKTMYGAKLVQNICEAVSRVIVTQAAIRITRMGYRILNLPHDELLILIKKDGQEEQHLQECLAEMKREPTWLPGIPLDAEGHLGERYSK